MIVIPKEFTRDVFNKEFFALIEWFNELESQLAYPNCDGKADEIRKLKTAHSELIKWGKV